MIDTLKRWFERPFSNDMDATGWALFVGFILALIVAWNYIINEIAD